jgi:arginyl-tRNA synthetase
MTTTIDPRAHLVDMLRTAVQLALPDAVQLQEHIHLERPRQAEHGDYSTNLAMQAARLLKANPRVLAQRLVSALPPSEWIKATHIAGAGFINFVLHEQVKTALIPALLKSGADYGRGIVGAKACRIQLEFVSANPTGPLHVGHGRGAAFGASLAALLAFAGHDVHREYYVNDAGRQMDILALSTWLRYLDHNGQAYPFPPNAYQGDYVRSMAAELTHNQGQRFMHPADVLPPPPDKPEQLEAHLDTLIATAQSLLGDDWAFIHRVALDTQLDECRADLEDFGVYFDQWYSEKSLYDSGRVAQAVTQLDDRGTLYEHEGARWFRSTAFGDEKDRVVQRDNGAYTYFASDIAYHLDKFNRGFDRVINIWGADHHGYMARVRGALTALGCDASRLDIALVQFVSLYRKGTKVSMSTRSGEYVTLRQLRDEVGNDACRFFYLLRKSDQALDFDLDLATAQTADNPVYYVQYAYARVCAVLRQWAGDPGTLQQAPVHLLTLPRELDLCSRLADFPETIAAAAHDLAPHTLAFYLRELASDFHSWYNAQRLLVEDVDLCTARLALAQAVREVIGIGLHILGVRARETM